MIVACNQRSQKRKAHNQKEIASLIWAYLRAMLEYSPRPWRKGGVGLNLKTENIG